MDTDEEQEKILGGESDARDPQTHAIIGAAMAVHTELGAGFLEGVYQEALAIQLLDSGIPYRREVDTPISFRGRILTTVYRADFVCFDSVLVELKALNALTSVEHAQVINYLKATNLTLGLLINFGASRLEYKRFIRSQHARPSSPHLRPSATSADNSSGINA